MEGWKPHHLLLWHWRAWCLQPLLWCFSLSNWTLVSPVWHAGLGSTVCNTHTQMNYISLTGYAYTWGKAPTDELKNAVNANLDSSSDHLRLTLKVSLRLTDSRVKMSNLGMNLTRLHASMRSIFGLMYVFSLHHNCTQD